MPQTTGELESYAAEAKERWGNTEAYQQSQERTKNFTKDDYTRLAKDGDDFMKALTLLIPKGPTSPEVQEMIAQHYDSLRAFYEPNLELYRGLAEMYVADSRFRQYYEKYNPAMPEFIRDAMIAYCDAH